MTAAERKAMALEQDQSGPRTAAHAFRDATVAAPNPVTLDLLIRALDRPLARSAQAPGRRPVVLRD
jgi:hypothetical protein